MAVFAHRIHLPNRILHQVEKDNQSRDWFWLKGYEVDPLKKNKKANHGKPPTKVSQKMPEIPQQFKIDQESML